MPAVRPALMAQPISHKHAHSANEFFSTVISLCVRALCRYVDARPYDNECRYDTALLFSLPENIAE